MQSLLVKGSQREREWAKFLDRYRFSNVPADCSKSKSVLKNAHRQTDRRRAVIMCNALTFGYHIIALSRRRYFANEHSDSVWDSNRFVQTSDFHSICLSNSARSSSSVSLWRLFTSVLRSGNTSASNDDVSLLFPFLIRPSFGRRHDFWAGKRRNNVSRFWHHDIKSQVRFRAHSNFLASLRE